MIETQSTAPFNVTPNAFKHNIQDRFIRKMKERVSKLT